MIFILFIFCFQLTSCNSSEQNTIKPKAKKGFLDLSEWDFKSDGIIPLNGEWEIYWKELLIPEDFMKADLSGERDYIEVPGFWNHKTFDGEIAKANGFATYRLRVKLSSRDQLLKFRIIQIHTACKVWINGELVAVEGKVSKTEGGASPSFAFKELDVPVESDSLDIIIQASNFHHREGGIRRSMHVGLQDQITSYGKNKLGLDHIVISILFVVSLFLIILFIYNPGERASIYLSLVCIISAIHFSTVSELIILNYFDEISWESAMRISHICNYLRLAFLVAFFRSFFPGEVPRIFSVVIMIWVGVSSLIVLFTKTGFFTAFYMQFAIVALVVILFMVVVLIKALKRRRGGSVLASIGIAILLVSGLNDLLHNAMIIQTGFFFPAGLVFSLFFLSFSISDRIVKLYKSVKMLTRSLVSLDKIKNAFIANTSRYNLEIPFKAILENVGADKGFIYIMEESQWILKVFMTFDKTKTLDPIKSVTDFTEPADDQTTFPYSLVRMVIAEQRNMLYDNSKEKSGLDSDAYLRRFEVKSAFCTRIESQGRLIGILYIENQNKERAFDRGKLEILDLLSPQLTTMLDNIEIFRQLEQLNIHLEQKVEERTTELNIQNQVLEVAQKKISESIQYARHIQTSVLLREEDIQIHLPGCFIYNKPRDVVSGDFCWFNRQGDKIVIAAIDCTGHGVPGAFMSMIGNILLNDIVIEKKIFKPSEILKRLNQGIAETLRQDQSKSHAQDGMDISLCSINHASRSLQFAGAKNPLYLIRKSRLEIIKADPLSIGGRIRKSVAPEEIEFTNHEISIENGMNVYLFSDGYLDQFGGENGEKFGTVRYKDLMMRISDKPMEEQKTEIALTMENWMQDQGQTDDMLIIGFSL